MKFLLGRPMGLEVWTTSGLSAFYQLALPEQRQSGENFLSGIRNSSRLHLKGGFVGEVSLVLFPEAN